VPALRILSGERIFFVGIVLRDNGKYNAMIEKILPQPSSVGGNNVGKM
jgi:hypothetical protein